MYQKSGDFEACEWVLFQNYMQDFTSLESVHQVTFTI